MEKVKEVDRRSSGKTIFKSRLGWTLSTQLGLLKTRPDGKSCCEVIFGAPTTAQGHGVRLD